MNQIPLRYTPMSLLPSPSKSTRVATNSGAELDGTDVTSGRAVVIAVDVAGKASLVGAKSAPNCPGSRRDRPHRSLDCRRPAHESGSGRRCFVRDPGSALAETLGTMSVGPGVKPLTPALPLEPNKLKLLVLT